MQDHVNTLRSYVVNMQDHVVLMQLYCEPPESPYAHAAIL